jgi:hypothetical protein
MCCSFIERYTVSPVPLCDGRMLLGVSRNKPLQSSNREGEIDGDHSDTPISIGDGSGIASTA